MYTIRNFRFTEQGWFADVIADGATLPHSIAFDAVNAADCRNFDQARITAACLPFEPMFGCWVDVVQPEPLKA